jgi:COP9 signalosome complex subunit 1
LLRLALIAATSSYLAVDALAMAIEEAKKGLDVGLYLQLVEALQDIKPAHPLAAGDKAWVDRRVKVVKAETERLEHELKGYKNNLIKESIRVSDAVNLISKRCRQAWRIHFALTEQLASIDGQ